MSPKEPEPRVEIPLPPPPITPPIFGPTIGTPRLRVRTGPESERDERLVEIDTPRVGSDDNWVQLGPTSYPRDFEVPYVKDKDNDGHTDFGMQVNITPDFYGLGVGAFGVAGGIVTGAAVGGVIAGVPTAGGGALPGAVIGGVLGFVGSAAPAIAFNKMNAHYAIGFNVEPGPVIDRIQDTASDAVDWAKDKAGDVKDWAKDKVDDLKGLNPFDGDGPPLLPPRGPLLPGPISGPISMRRLDEAFARLQSLL